MYVLGSLAELGGDFMQPGGAGQAGLSDCCFSDCAINSDVTSEIKDLLLLFGVHKRGEK